MKTVAIDLEQLSSPALYEIAKCSTDKTVLEALFEIGVKKLENDQNPWLLHYFSWNHSPQIKEILEKVCALDNEIFLYDSLIHSVSHSHNPFTPSQLLGKQLMYGNLEAAKNPNAPAEELNNLFPQILFFNKNGIVQTIVKLHAEKLSNATLQMIIKELPDFELAKTILDERTNS